MRILTITAASLILISCGNKSDSKDEAVASEDQAAETVASQSDAEPDLAVEQPAEVSAPKGLQGTWLASIENYGTYFCAIGVEFRQTSYQYSTFCTDGRSTNIETEIGSYALEGSLISFDPVKHSCPSEQRFQSLGPYRVDGDFLALTIGNISYTLERFESSPADRTTGTTTYGCYSDVSFQPDPNFEITTETAPEETQ